ncbi:MAG: RNase adapter RapZ [Clostridiales bacterium]|jgi:UPF0042 nucleotide-binding protein|nr:RNase adapter RapZ [Clostridiales bacterium]
MLFTIVTGMSGAGKSMALKFLEDIDFFCIDNLPPQLIPRFAEICMKADNPVENVALGIDIRGGKLFNDLFNAIGEMKNFYHYDVKILFLDASNDVLITRYKESRRSHPLVKGDGILAGIEMERELLREVKGKADYIIDTSQILTRQLKEQINSIFLTDKKFLNLMITVMSFGFKYGIPQEADLVFDVRFLPNPFYIPELKEKTGEDDEVKQYVLNNESATVFLNKFYDMLDFLIPNYVVEGKNRLCIAIGCTGGKHRSVTLAYEIYNALQKKEHSVIIMNRDIKK